jgi:2-polyprenyl-3-methyl-5-hydroxy-6-metoxy-1,4-benzoquinol methylase
MKIEDTHNYRCPDCGSDVLTLITLENGEVDVGELRCTCCGVHFPIHNSIPRFVASKNYAGSFGFQWTLHEKTQLDSHTGLSISSDRLFGVTGWPASMPGQKILEAGSGAGRFTECLLKTGAEVFSFDYSAAVDANWRNNGSSNHLHLFQGDLRKIPLPKRSFDKVMCLGVLQHTPDPRASFLSLAEMVRSGGELVIDVYRKDLLALLQWKYVLRPLTTKMSPRNLYGTVSRAVPLLLPAARLFRKIAGRAGARLFPISEYSHLGLTEEQNKQWSILDTFDAYAPSHDHPQTQKAVEGWFLEAGFVDMTVSTGANGIIGKGRRSSSTSVETMESKVAKACVA